MILKKIQKILEKFLSFEKILEKFTEIPVVERDKKNYRARKNWRKIMKLFLRARKILLKFLKKFLSPKKMKKFFRKITELGKNLEIFTISETLLKFFWNFIFLKFRRIDRISAKFPLLHHCTRLTLRLIPMSVLLCFAIRIKKHNNSYIFKHFQTLPTSSLFRPFTRHFYSLTKSPHDI